MKYFWNIICVAFRKSDKYTSRGDQNRALVTNWATTNFLCLVKLVKHETNWFFSQKLVEGVPQGGLVFLKIPPKEV